jgi:hypothetical protein
MPRWRQARLRRLPDDQRDVLLGGMGGLLEQRRAGEPYADVVRRLFGSVETARATWDAHRVELLAACLAEHGPGTRPAAWWHWDSPDGPMPEPMPADQRSYLADHGLLRTSEQRALTASEAARRPLRGRTAASRRGVEDA